MKEIFSLPPPHTCTEKEVAVGKNGFKLRRLQGKGARRGEVLGKLFWGWGFGLEEWMRGGEGKEREREGIQIAFAMFMSWIGNLGMLFPLYQSYLFICQVTT